MSNPADYCIAYFEFVEWMDKRGRALSMTNNEADFANNVLSERPVLDNIKAIGSLIHIFRELIFFIKETQR